MHSACAIILKNVPHGEADALVTLYTKEFGKIRAIATGVKKEQAKLKGHLEPLNFSFVHFVTGKRGERLTSARALESWGKIRDDLDRLMHAQSILHMFDRACFERMADEGMWMILYETLISLERGDAPLAGREFLSRIEKKVEIALGNAPLASI